MSEDYYHIFLDEGGNLDFSPKGTKYFTLTSVTRLRSFETDNELNQLRFELLESGRDIEYFHATADKQEVRNKVFDVIKNHLDTFRIDSLIVEKRKTGPALQIETRFYPEMLSYLLGYVLNGLELRPVIIITDAIPFKKKRRAIRRAIQKNLNRKLPNHISYTTYHHASKSSYGLQIADYCNWAIFRKWERNDERSYNFIKLAIQSEFEIFRSGQSHYY